MRSFMVGRGLYRGGPGQLQLGCKGLAEPAFSTRWRLKTHLFYVYPWARFLGYQRRMTSFPTIADLSAALASGAVTASSLLEDSIARSEAATAHGVYVSRFDAAARRAAEEADAARSRGQAPPYAGVPITIKDNLDVAGMATTAGSKILAQAQPAQADAPVVRKLRAAGFVIPGRTNMTEFAFSGLGVNPHYGTPLNPRFSAPHVPGGSSSGAIVSVALGLAPAAIGTDTGGSVRIPAALHGLVGFKPSQAAVSREGVLPLSVSFDTVGVMAQTVADCRAVFDVIRDDSKAAPRAPKRRIGVLTNFVMSHTQSEVEAGFRVALERLAAGGIAVQPIAIPILDEIPEMNRNGTIQTAECFAWHAEHLPDAPDSAYDPRVIARIRPGGKVDALALRVLRARRQEIIDAFSNAAQDFDALVWPTVPMIAPAIAELARDEDYHRINGLILRNPMVVNLADGCSISLPCPVTGAPVGIMLSSARGNDDALLAFAEEAERLLR